MEDFTISLTLDKFGDTMIGVNTEEFSPLIVVGMLEAAKSKILGHMAMGIMAARQNEPQLLVPDSQLLVPR